MINNYDGEIFKGYRPAIMPLFFLLLLSLCLAAGADTHTAASCSQANVISAVAAAADGDTVIVPAGTATWTAGAGTACEQSAKAALCILTGITFKGAGSGSTIITLSGTANYGMIQYKPGATTTANNVPFEMSGFTFDAGGASWPGTFSMHNDDATHVQTKIKIHDNVFLNNLAQAMEINGLAYGVIYKNTFTDCNYCFAAFGGDANGWAATTRAYGTSENLFFEDNIINYTYDAGGGSGESYTGQGCCGIVFRYNTFNLANATPEEMYDVHGLQSMTNSNYICNGACPTGGTCYASSCCEQWSTVKCEYYGNKYINVNGGYEWMGHRGSWLLMFNNLITGSGNPPILYQQYSCDECQKPASPVYSQHIQNTYIWNNYVNSTRKDMVKDADYCGDNVSGAPYVITANRDYYNYNASFNGTSGIGCGTLANRPATCTKGVGYWATDYPTPQNTPTDIDSMIKYCQAGTFYKATATNTWTFYYKPYTYPHPLRNENKQCDITIGRP